MMDSDTEKVRALVAKTYTTLPLLEQLIVQLCSVLYEPVARVVIVACFNYLPEQDRRPFLGQAGRRQRTLYERGGWHDKAERQGRRPAL